MVRRGDDEQEQWTYWPLHTLPRSLDIVWCRFPELNLSEPGPKSRPGLVRSVELSTDHKRARVEVCYGTSKLKHDLYPTDLFIENASRMAQLGLTQSTRFELDRTLILPWAKEFFSPKDGSRTPIIGHLSEPEITQLETLKRLKAAHLAPRR
jgi:hypothetical protein